MKTTSASSETNTMTKNAARTRRVAGVSKPSPRTTTLHAISAATLLGTGCPTATTTASIRSSFALSGAFPPDRLDRTVATLSSLLRPRPRASTSARRCISRRTKRRLRRRASMTTMSIRRVQGRQRGRSSAARESKRPTTRRRMTAKVTRWCRAVSRRDRESPTWTSPPTTALLTPPKTRSGFFARSSLDTSWASSDCNRHGGMRGRTVEGWAIGCGARMS